MLKPTIQVTVFSIFGIVINFIIQLLLAYFFGASEERDAYYAALTIPAYIAVLFTGSIGMLFIPHLIGYSSSKDPLTRDLISPAINFMSILLVCIIIVSAIFAAPLVDLIVPVNKPTLTETTVYLFRILMVSSLFTVLNNLLASAFQSRHSFLFPSVSTIITSLTSLVSVALLSPVLGISSIAYGTLVGGALAFIFLFFQLNRKFQYQWNRRIISLETGLLLKTALPLFATGVIFRSTTVFERYFAARLPEGSLSYLGNANQIVIILSTLVSTGIATTSFPRLSEHWSAKDTIGFQRTFLKVLDVIFMIVMILITLFVLSGREAIAIFFQHGEFTANDTAALYNTLLGLMGFFLFSSMGNVVARVLYIANHTKVAGLIAISELLIYVICAVYFGRRYGYVGLALSLSVASACNVIATLLYIHRSIIPLPAGRFVARTLLIVSFSLVMILTLFLLGTYLSGISSFLRAGILTLLALLLYWIMLAFILKDKYYLSFIQLVRNKIKSNG